jgi:hypothetical protein
MTLTPEQLGEMVVRLSEELFDRALDESDRVECTPVETAAVVELVIADLVASVAVCFYDDKADIDATLAATMARAGEVVEGYLDWEKEQEQVQLEAWEQDGRG